MTEPTIDQPAKRTALHDLHTELGGRLVDFAGWELPIQYEGVLAEHLWCRQSASLFDVSHMGVVELHGATLERQQLAMEHLTPAAITSLGAGKIRYSLLTNDAGGVIDDCMVTNTGERLSLVVNASRRDIDLAHLRKELAAFDPEVEVVERTDLSLLAVQGPKAADVIGALSSEANELYFLEATTTTLGGIEVSISRSGYTGEDGFEIAVANDAAEALARLLLASDLLQPAGLGARDTLRLEAGLCLYGNDLDEATTPVEADLVWTMPSRRREAADFIGADAVMDHFNGGVERIRVGLKPLGRRPVRDGAALRDAEGNAIGVVSSGGFGPSVDHPVAMGYVHPDVSALGQQLVADVRGKSEPVEVAALPFFPHRYQRRPR